MTETGRVIAVNTITAGDYLTADTTAGATTLVVDDASDFDEAGGYLRLNGEILPYTSADVESDTIALGAATTLPGTAADRVDVWEVTVGRTRSETHATVAVEGLDADDTLDAIVTHNLVPFLRPGIQPEPQPACTLVYEGEDLIVTSLIGQTPVLSGAYLATGETDANALGYNPLAGVLGNLVPDPGFVVPEWRQRRATGDMDEGWTFEQIANLLPTDPAAYTKSAHTTTLTVTASDSPRLDTRTVTAVLASATINEVFVTVDVDVVEGETYTFQLDQATGTFHANLQWLNAGSGIISQGAVADNTSPPPAVLAPATAVKARLQFLTDAALTGTIMLRARVWRGDENAEPGEWIASSSGIVGSEGRYFYLARHIPVLTGQPFYVDLTTVVRSTTAYLYVVWHLIDGTTLDESVVSDLPGLSDNWAEWSGVEFTAPLNAVAADVVLWSGAMDADTDLVRVANVTVAPRGASSDATLDERGLFFDAGLDFSYTADVYQGYWQVAAFGVGSVYFDEYLFSVDYGAGSPQIEVNSDGSGHVGPYEWDADYQADTGWIAPTLTNSWANYDAAGTGYAQAGYRRIGKQVFLKGFVKLGTDNTAIFTLPVGFRPAEDSVFSGAVNVDNEATGAASAGTAHTHPVAIGTPAIRVDVTAAGVVKKVCSTAANGYLSLNGISFLID